MRDVGFRDGILWALFLWFPVFNLALQIGKVLCSDVILHKCEEYFISVFIREGNVKVVETLAYYTENR